MLTIRVWDPARPDAEPLVLSYGAERDVVRVVALPDGRLVSGAGSGLIRIRPVPLG